MISDKRSQVSSRKLLKTFSKSVQKEASRIENQQINRMATQSTFHARCTQGLDKQHYEERQKFKPYRTKLLTEKFHNLHIKNKVEKEFRQTTKIKLNLKNSKVIKQHDDKLQLLEKQNIQEVNKNDRYAARINQNMNNLYKKMEEQSSFIRNSIQKFQKTLQENVKIRNEKSYSKIMNAKQMNSEVQIINGKIIQIQSQLQAKVQQIKKLKSINTFLTSQNYKIIIQNNILIEKIIQAQQKEFANCDQVSFAHLKTDKNLQKQQILRLKQIINQKNQQILVLNKQIQAIKKEAELSKDTLVQHTKQLYEDEIKKLKFTICQLERQTNDRYIQNINLATRLSRIQTIPVNIVEQLKKESSCQHKSLKHKSRSAVSISIKSQKNSQISSKQSQQPIKSQFGLSQKVPILSSQVSYKPIKSQILSNRILYYSEAQESKQKQSKSNIKKAKVSFSVQNSQKKIQKNNKLQINPSQCLSRRRKSVSHAVTIKIEQQALKKTKFKSAINFYSQAKVKQLQVIRQSISLKFQAFKYTSQIFQNQMVNWPTYKISQNQMIKILSAYPFFLDQFSMKLVMDYCNPEGHSQIRVDVFCNKIREFTGNYDQVSQEDQVIIEKKIYNRWKYASQEILDMLRRLQITPGIVTKAVLVQILSEMKFDQKQIHYLLAQSVSISQDILHIKYKQYFQQIFSSKR